MRTTVRIDPDKDARLRELTEERGISFREALTTLYVEGSLSTVIQSPIVGGEGPRFAARRRFGQISRTERRARGSSNRFQARAAKVRLPDLNLICTGRQHRRCVDSYEVLAENPPLCRDTRVIWSNPIG